MITSDSYALLLIGAILVLIKKFSSLIEENTLLKISQIETELFYDESLFEKMVIEATGSEIDWDRSTIATKKRRIDQLKLKLNRLSKKKRRLYIFFF